MTRRACAHCNGSHCLSVRPITRTLSASGAWGEAIMRTVFLLLALLAGTMTANAAALAPPQGRLSDDVTPTAYRLDLTVDPSRARFSGHTEIDALLTQPSTV